MEFNKNDASAYEAVILNIVIGEDYYIQGKAFWVRNDRAKLEFLQKRLVGKRAFVEVDNI